jgi:hypothetical protein
MKFEEKPDYTQLSGLFKELLASRRESNDCFYDWLGHQYESRSESKKEVNFENDDKVEIKMQEEAKGLEEYCPLESRLPSGLMKKKKGRFQI